MDIALGSLKHTAALTFLDDILVPGIDFQGHLQKLELVLNALQKVGLTFKPLKCIFAAQSIKFLGHIIEKREIYADVKK